MSECLPFAMEPIVGGLDGVHLEPPPNAMRSPQPRRQDASPPRSPEPEVKVVVLKAGFLNVRYRGNGDRTEPEVEAEDQDSESLLENKPAELR